MPPEDLKDYVAVVTGAARGMGRAYVEGFLAAGASVVALDRSWAGVEDFKASLEAGKTAVPLEVDITSDAQLDSAYRRALETFGTVDVLVNNAAMRQRDLYPPTGRVKILQTHVDDWKRAYDVNVFGTLRVIQRFIQPMLEKRRGSIVNVSSSGSYINIRPGSGEQPYMSSKAALVNFSFYLAEEVKESNVAVNVVFPGHTRTTGSEEQEAARRAINWAGAVPIEPEHIVPVVLFLAEQDAQSGVTGRAISAVDWNLEHGLGGADAWRRTNTTAASR